MTTEKKQRSSYKLVGLYAVIIIGFTLPNMLSPSVSWNMFSFSLGWSLSFLTVILSYGFTETMRTFPWFWNTILASDARVLALSELFGLAGCFISLLLDLSGAGVAIGLSAAAAIVIALLVYRLSSE